MRILLSCGGMMSSSQLAEYIKDAATKKGIDLEIDATGIDHIEDDLHREKYDLLLLAPQVSYRADYVRKQLEEQNIPLVLIKGNLYNPLYAGEILEDIKEFL